MYEIGQLIVYGNEGVCRVEEIGTPKISGVDKHRDYYTLAPIYREGKVFTPVDSKVFMRPVITREEALALIDRIPQMTAEVYENSNLRFLNEHYQQCIQNYTCADLLQLIKDVRAKRRQMTERGKKLGKALLTADVRHERDLFIPAARGKAQLGELRQQRRGHIVHAVKVQILQHVGRAALAAAGQARYDQKFHPVTPG